MQKMSEIKLKIKHILIIVIELSIVADNQICQNSTYLMLERLLKLHSHLTLFIDEAIEKDNPLNPADILSKDDWATLQIVHDLLKLFWKMIL